MISDNPQTLLVLGVPIGLKSGADTDRIREAAGELESRYDRQVRASRGGQNRDVLVAFMALGLADDLLQLQKRHQETLRRLEELLTYIEESR